MSRKTARITEAHIHRAREVLKPEPVRLHHVPNWLRLRMKETFGAPYQVTSGDGVLFHASSKTGKGRWLDHWGSSHDRGGERRTFVSEPYDITPETVRDIISFTEPMGLDFYISSNSYWFPGRTVRVVIPCPDDKE